jgi:tetratricopeptide (TPR) repeat protein
MQTNEIIGRSAFRGDLGTTPVQDRLSWCDVEPEIKQLLLLASENWEYTGLAEKYIREALFKAGDNHDVLVSAYRFFFYKHKPATALSIAQQVLVAIATTENLPNDWSQLKPILSDRITEPNIRLYLNAYAAKGLILAQLGRIEEAKVISQRVKEIDDSRQFCATTVFEVITRSSDEDE